MESLKQVPTYLAGSSLLVSIGTAIYFNNQISNLKKENDDGTHVLSTLFKKLKELDPQKDQIKQLFELLQKLEKILKSQSESIEDLKIYNDERELREQIHREATFELQDFLRENHGYQPRINLDQLPISKRAIQIYEPRNYSSYYQQNDERNDRDRDRDVSRSRGAGHEARGVSPSRDRNRSPDRKVDRERDKEKRHRNTDHSRSSSRSNSREKRTDKPTNHTNKDHTNKEDNTRQTRIRTRENGNGQDPERVTERRERSVSKPRVNKNPEEEVDEDDIMAQLNSMKSPSKEQVRV